MFRLAAIPFLLIFCYTPISAQSNPAVNPANSSQQPKKDSKAKPDGKAQPKALSSLTGCVDEQEGQWVLISDQSLAVIANLAADGFPTEAFAKHVGHRVTVRGTSSSDGPRTQFKVREIETISDTCAAK